MSKRKVLEIPISMALKLKTVVRDVAIACEPLPFSEVPESLFTVLSDILDKHNIPSVSILAVKSFAKEAYAHAHKQIDDNLSRGDKKGLKTKKSKFSGIDDLVANTTSADFLSTTQAAEVLNVSRPHVVKLIESGQLKAHKVGRYRRVAYIDLIEFKELMYSRAISKCNSISRIAQSEEASTFRTARGAPDMS